MFDGVFTWSPFGDGFTATSHMWTKPHIVAVVACQTVNAGERAWQWISTSDGHRRYLDAEPLEETMSQEQREANGITACKEAGDELLRYLMQQR